MTALLYTLCGVIVLQQILHHCERKDLYDRIMSKNLTEYKGEAPSYQISAHKSVLNRWRARGGGEEE